MKRTLKLLACTLAVVLTSANAFSQVIYPSAEGWTKAKPEEMSAAGVAAGGEQCGP